MTVRPADIPAAEAQRATISSIAEAWSRLPALAIGAGESGRRLWRTWLRPILSAIRWLFPAAALVYLAHNLTQIGWHRIWGSLPSHWTYYVLLVLLFLLLPASELLIYRSLWNVGKQLGLSVLLRKQFLNGLMIEYSGESYFFVWASRHLGLPRRTLLHSIKDSNVLSAGAGLLTAWLMLSALVTTGAVRFPFHPSGYVWLYAAVAVFPLLLCLALVLGRRKLTTLGGRQLAWTFGVHLTRCVLSQVLQFGLWSLSGALPSAIDCLNFVMLRLLISRLPLAPNKDLIFVGSGLAAAASMDLTVAPVAAVLVTISVSDQVLNLLLTGVPWLAERLGRLSGGLQSPRLMAPEEPAADAGPLR